ncbi:CLUMA_CG005697, isoform A [Clunio marinus]|uniref:CLUMA_CG005697, isoform A n=1 Tax=Clunio marinus TaxID=568069 RepID=A0A1J1HXQ6_9DIPT|nr:CLUMA_CG005697, isoform A [Clunio marinus]
MVFKCQTDSFLKEFETEVVKVEKNEEGKSLVQFEDTVLFPEGGGQPTDHGKIILKRDEGKEIEFDVKNVIRKGPDAIHYIESTDTDVFLKVGDKVKQIVDWERRHDNMQQHSAQHLISGLFEIHYKYPTRAWWLGADVSYIELDAKNITDNEMKHIECMVNVYIASATPVHVLMFDTADATGEEVTRAAKGLPVDLSGPVRVINIEGIESNMCCGTHVSNLAQLQMVKLLNIEKTKGKTIVKFLAGNRVFKKLETSFQREVQLTAMLNNGPDSHIDLVKKLQTNLKSSQKTLQKLSKELATKIAEELNAKTNLENYFSLHNKDGVDVDFSNTFLRVLKSKSLFVFMTIADAIDSKSGSLIIQGNPKDIEALADPICKLLNGKGNGKNNRFNAKVTQLNKVKDCEILIKNHFANKKISDQV